MVHTHRSMAFTMATLRCLVVGKSRPSTLPITRGICTRTTQPGLSYAVLATKATTSPAFVTSFDNVIVRGYATTTTRKPKKAVAKKPGPKPKKKTATKKKATKKPKKKVAKKAKKPKKKVATKPKRPTVTSIVSARKLSPYAAFVQDAMSKTKGSRQLKDMKEAAAAWKALSDS